MILKLSDVTGSQPPPPTTKTMTGTDRVMRGEHNNIITIWLVSQSQYNLHLLTCLSDCSTLLCLVLLPAFSLVQAGPVSSDPPSWVLTSLDSPMAYLQTRHAMTWVEAEDYCQQMYGHLATDDSQQYLREFLRLTKTAGDVWIGLHQTKPQTQFTWT